MMQYWGSCFFLCVCVCYNSTIINPAANHPSKATLDIETLAAAIAILTTQTTLKQQTRSSVIMFAAPWGGNLVVDSQTPSESCICSQISSETKFNNDFAQSSAIAGQAPSIKFEQTHKKKLYIIPLLNKVEYYILNLKNKSFSSFSFVLLLDMAACQVLHNLFRLIYKRKSYMGDIIFFYINGLQR